MLSKTAMSLAAGAGLCFLGYCVYFDRKRRNDPDFKRKLRERRQKAKQQKPQGSCAQFPDVNDADAMQKFFLQEIQMGEELLASQDIEGGVEHLSNAVAVCGQPQQLLQVLQQTLPPQVFALLVQKLPTTGRRLAGAAAAAGGGSSAAMEEDELE